MRNKLQVTLNKSICLFKTQLRQHIGAKEFEEIKWLPAKERAEQRTVTKAFNYWKGISPFYVNELFVPSEIRTTLGHKSLLGYL